MTDIEPLVRSLAHRDVVSDYERKLIAGLKWRRRRYSKGEELVAIHSRPGESCLVLSGFTAREVFLSDGQRQITALHVPGDFVDLHALTLKVMDHSVVALTDCEAAYVPHYNLLQAIEKSPHLGRLFWLSTVVDGAIQRAWIASMGRRSAHGHLGHMVCELYSRLDAIGLTTGFSFEFPVIQPELADILGLSLVHVNRTLQELRRTGLVDWRDGVVTILDWKGLVSMADFDPTYLNLVTEPR